MARPLATNIQQPKTGALRAPLKMGVEVSVSGRRIHIHVKRQHISSTGKKNKIDPVESEFQ